MVAFARRSPSARLYSLVPRSSQCPSTRTSMFSCDFNQAALASSVLASLGRTSYLSKSKKMSLRSAIAANSRGTGRAPPAVLPPLGVGVPLPPRVPPGCTAAGALEAPSDGPLDGPVDPATPVGAGAEAAVVAGRFAQLTKTTTNVSKAKTLAIRREHEMTSVRRPRRALIVAGPRGETAGIGTVGADGPQVVGTLARSEDDHVTARGPAGLGVMPTVGELPHARALGVHHEHVGTARPITDERDLLSRR